MLSKELLILASAGGILPALLWLWFWLREDKKNPEPRKILALTFLGGMVSVLPILIFQLSINSLNEKGILDLFFSIFPLAFLGSGILLIISYAAVEEIFKFIACYFTALRGKENNEPLDPIIYMIVAALGFAAIENTFFIISAYLNPPVIGQEFISSLIVVNIRFISASLIHVASSASIGIFIALSYYKKRSTKIFFIILGVITAISLHSYFNSLIINKGDIGFLLSMPFAWLAIVVLIFLFEKIKRLN